MYGLNAEHIFRFSPSESGTPEHTTFIQEESFSGIFGWVMDDTKLARIIGAREGTKTNFEAFNKDFKAECEKES